MKLPTTLLLAMTGVSVLNIAYALEPVKELCRLQSKASVTKPPGPGDLLKMREMSKAEEEAILKKRACLQSYAQQFPGGLEKMMASTYADIKANLVDLRTAFPPRTANELRAAYSSPRTTTSAMGEADTFRRLLVNHGWDREQVLLWGSLFMIRAAYREGDYDAALVESEKVRNEFGLKAEKLQFWDELQEHTYFSPQALRNMIVAVEFLAKVRKPGSERKEMEGVVAEYMRDREALIPFANFVGNPDSVMFRGLCGNKK